MSAKLGLQDIADLRAYERERPEFLAQVIGLKKIRRLAIGPYLTAVFENRQTVRFQIQEMARAEKMVSDNQIATELAIYNTLVPEHGELSMTLFIELTSESELRTWLPKLVGIESAIEISVGTGERSRIVPAEVEPDHASQLTRDDITASVHYLKARLTPDLVGRFAEEEVHIVAAHEAYRYETTLSDATKSSILQDWSET